MSRLAGALLACVAACSRAPSDPGRAPGDAPRPLFVERSAALGIDFVHAHGGVGDRELPETMGGGVALLDVELDGDLDVYLVQSGPVRTPGDGEDRSGAENALFLQRSDRTFERASDAAGAADRGYGQGCAAGDTDGDGDSDLVVLNWGPNGCYRNDGGRFVEAGEGLPGARAPDARWSVSAAFLDHDADGDLDLYVANYLVCPPSSHLDGAINPTAPGPFAAYPHPDRFPAERDRLLENRGDGSYADVTAERGADPPPGKGLGVVPTDCDLDGWTDLYVANDSTPNFLFVNRGDGTFEERGARAGVAFNGEGRTEAGMGVDTADVDLDGDLDLFVTNLYFETNTLYVNGGGLRFRDRTTPAGLAQPSRLLVGFGALFEDFDRDGDPDLLVANGHIIDNVAELSPGRTYAQPKRLSANHGDGTFETLPPEIAGPSLEEPEVSRGSAVGDLDGDGDLDVVVAQNGGGARAYLGTAGDGRAGRAWLALALEGPAGNPRGEGALVRLALADGRALVRFVTGSRSYASSSDPRWHVGLPSPVERVEVVWPGGARESWRVGGRDEPFEGRRALRFGTGERE